MRPLIQHRPHGYYRTGSSAHLIPENHSAAQMRAAGIGLKTLLSSRFRKIFYDCYVSSSVPLTTRIRAKAALGISPLGSFLSHSTAARIWGGIVPNTPDVHVTVQGTAGRSSRQGVKAHAAVEGTATTCFRNLPITTPEQTFLDLATSLNLVALVVLGDSIVKAGRTSAAALRDAALAWRGRGAKLARRAARYVREGVDSAMETRLRMLLILAGLPVPEVNVILRHPDGSGGCASTCAIRHSSCHRVRRKAPCRGQRAMAA